MTDRCRDPASEPTDEGRRASFLVRWSWLGRTGGWALPAETDVVRWLRASARAASWPAPRSRLILRKKPPRSLTCSSQLNRWLRLCCGSQCRPKTSEVGTDLRAVRHRRHWRFRRNRPTSGARRALASLWRGLRSCPEDLPGRDRSPSGPAPQTLELSENSSYPGSVPRECQAVTVPLDQSCWLFSLPLERRCSRVTGL